MVKTVRMNRNWKATQLRHIIAVYRICKRVSHTQNKKKKKKKYDINEFEWGYEHKKYTTKCSKNTQDENSDYHSQSISSKVNNAINANFFLENCIEALWKYFIFGVWCSVFHTQSYSTSTQCFCLLCAR